MPLCYAMLCNVLQGALPKLSFLAKPCKHNRHDNQMTLVDPLEGDKSNTPITHGHSWYGLDHEPAHDHDHNYNHGPDSHGLSNHGPNRKPWNFMHVGCSSIA